MVRGKWRMATEKDREKLQKESERGRQRLREGGRERENRV